MIGLVTVLLVAGSASAELLTLTDGGDGSPYGDTEGFVVDFDSSFTSWSTTLVAGQSYSVDSISIWEASDAVAGDRPPVYLSVFDSTFGGYDGDTSAEHLGFSDNAIDHGLTPDTSKITYTFTGITVTADSDGALSGSGLLYFFWDDDTIRNNFSGSGGVQPYQRIDSNPSASDPAYGAAVHAFGAIQTSRVPEIEISVTAIPEPATIGLVGIFGAGVFFVRRRFMI